MQVKYFLVFAVMIGTSWAESESTTTDQPVTMMLSPVLEEHTDAIAEVQDKVLSTIQRRCEKYGGPEAFQKYQSVGHEFGECIQTLVNNTALQKEIELAKKTGSVDEVFKKYCEKTPQFEECVLNATETAKVCLSPDEQAQLKTVKLVAEELAKFICFKEGDRIALFIADGGPECFQAHQEALKECANRTLGVQNNLGDDIIEKNIISFDEEHCKKITAFQVCAVKTLEQCERPTTANIVESLFKFAKQSTPCKNFTVTRDEDSKPRSQMDEPSAAIGQSATMATIITFVFTVFVFNF